MENERKIISWFTSNGARIPVYEGESTEDAFKRHRLEQEEALKKKQIEANKKEADSRNDTNKLDYSNTPVVQVNDDEKNKLKEELKSAKAERKAFLVENKEKLDGELDYGSKIVRQYQKLSENVANKEFEAHRTMPPVILDASKYETKVSALTHEEAVIPRKDLLSNKKLYLAIQSAAAGTANNDGKTLDTAVDSLYKKDPNGIYSVFSNTRNMLKAKYGDEITLYRVNTNATKKPTINMTSTKYNAQQYADWYGGKVTSQKVSVDKILAINIDRQGRYEEFIVLQ